MEQNRTGGVIQPMLSAPDEVEIDIIVPCLYRYWYEPAKNFFARIFDSIRGIKGDQYVGGTNMTVELLVRFPDGTIRYHCEELTGKTGAPADKKLGTQRRNSPLVRTIKISKGFTLAEQ